jgi:cytochrome c oxidase subunit 4
MSEDEAAHVRLYKKIGATLLVLTIVTVAVSYVELAVPLAITIALIVALTKGSLVASYFMHLVGERKSILAALALTTFFFMVLLLIPILGLSDTTGELKTMSNADAPVVEHGATH